jgi:CheY-like chemotaxis protein
MLLASAGVTYADLDCRLSIVDNIDDFKMPLIDGAETVSTVLNNAKIRFRKLPVILITFRRKKKYALEDLH